MKSRDSFILPIIWIILATLYSPVELQPVIMGFIRPEKPGKVSGMTRYDELANDYKMMEKRVQT